MASVAGLAPARLRWKDGLREVLCIHGRKGGMECWSNGVLEQRLPRFPTFQYSNTPSGRMVPEVGIAPTSPRLQRGANLPQLLRARNRVRYQCVRYQV